MGGIFYSHAELDEYLDRGRRVHEPPRCLGELQEQRGQKLKRGERGFLPGKGER